MKVLVRDRGSFSSMVFMGPRIKTTLMLKCAKKLQDINRHVWLGIVYTYIKQMHVDVIALLQGRDSDTVKCYYREQ
jgi:hypothetical protein